jgi:hypothetical protein
LQGKTPTQNKVTVVVVMFCERFFHSNAFEPEMVKRLCDAYDLATEALRDGGQTDIEPEVVARHVISLARQGVTDTTSLCLRTLRALSGESAVNTNPRPTDVEYLRCVHAATKQTVREIAQSLALVDTSNSLIARIDRQLSQSI